MPTPMTDVRDFLALRRIALVGMSRDPQDFSRYLFREMCEKGYDMVPVNPSARELEGKACFGRTQDIQPPVEGALLMTAPDKTEQVVRDCAQAGIRYVWMHRGGGLGSVSKKAVEFCRERGIRMVEGHCPLMFLPHTAFFHRVHGFILKVMGTYPSGSHKGAASAA